MAADQHTPNSAASAVGSTESVQALERRQLLLKGLRKGGTALAGGLSVSAMADVYTPDSDKFLVRLKTPDNKMCTVSGNQSAVGHSGPAINDVQVCSGNPPGTYAGQVPIGTAGTATSAWPATVPVNVRFFDIFLRDPVTSAVVTGARLRVVDMLAQAPNDDDSVWALAYLNAVKLKGSGKFPYGPGDVIEQGRANDPKALALYRNVLSR